MENNFISILQRIWQIEFNKFNKKGMTNITIAFSLLILYFYYVPIFVREFWHEDVENSSAFRFYTTFSIHIVSTFTFSLIYIPGYLGVQAYKKYQIEPKLKKSWQRENWKQITKKTFWNLILNYTVIVPIYIYIGLTFEGSQELNHFPSHYQIIKQMCIILLADDFIEMIIHQMFHLIPFLYRYHKVHHEYETPYCLSTQYIHPIQQIFGNLLPATIVFSIYNVHILVYFMWQGFKMYSSIESHSGYDFPWSPVRLLPFIYGPSYHYFHHTKNVGNYSTNFYIFQLFIGTNKAFLNYDLGKQAKDSKIK